MYWTDFEIYSCSQNGEICLMDVKEIFDMIHLCDDSVFSLCQSPGNNASLYFGEGNGNLKVFDERAGKISGIWKLHRDCISSIDANPENAYMLATSSLDSTACIWDLRNMKMLTPESLKVVEHKMCVHSAYFSPSGSILATTRSSFYRNSPIFIYCVSRPLYSCVICGLNFEVSTHSVYHIYGTRCSSLFSCLP
jgi:WD40 repeat protein